MVVFIQFLGSQRNISKTERITMPITDKSVAGDAMVYLKERYPELRLEEEKHHLAVNHVVVAANKRLKQNDIITLIPHIGGG